MYSEQASILANDANFYFFKRIPNLPINPPIQAQRAVGHHWPARLERSGVSRDSVKTKLNQSR